MRNPTATEGVISTVTTWTLHTLSIGSCRRSGLRSFPVTLCRKQSAQQTGSSVTNSLYMTSELLCLFVSANRRFFKLYTEAISPSLQCRAVCTTVLRDSLKKRKETQIHVRYIIKKKTLFTQCSP